MASTLTVKEIAEKIGTTPRILRKFLRAETVENGGTVGVDTPGKGKRYSYTTAEARGIQKRFKAWYAEKPEPSTDENPEAEEEVVETESEVEVELEV